MKVKVYFGKMMYDVMGVGIDPLTDYPCLLCIWEESEESDYHPKDNLPSLGLRNLDFCVSINDTVYGIGGIEIVEENLVFSAI